MSDQDIVMEILSITLLDIRTASVDGNTRITFALSDFVHNVPYQISRVGIDGRTYSDIIKYLIERAEEKNISKWFRRTLEEIGVEI